MIRRPVLILALLTTLNLINYLDRFLVMAVGPRIQEARRRLVDNQEFIPLA